MPPPSQPTLTLARLSGTSFSASVSGGDPSATHSLYYARPGVSVFTTASSTVTGNGSFSNVTGLVTNATYVAYAVGLLSGSYSLPGFSWVSLAAPGDLAGAVHQLFSGDPALAAAVPGGLWTGEVPEGTAFPYAWLELPEELTLPTTVDQLESAKLSFHLWGIGAEAASDAAIALKAVFDYATLPPFGDSVSVGTWPVSRRLQCEGLRDASSRLVFRSVVTYRVVTQRPR